MSTFEELAVNPLSEKINLVTIDSLKLHKIFNLESGNIYSLNTQFFVVSVKNADLPLSQVAGTAPGLNEWSFAPELKKLFINIGDNPKKGDISITYRHFFSNAPVIASWDLANGTQVEWLPIVTSIGTVGQQLDDENTGIVLESSSSVDLINQDGFFDLIYDTHIWENKSVKFYQWFGSLPISEARRVFDGIIETKDFSPERITFKVKDFVFRLRDNVKLGEFSSNDGNISPSLIGKSKRRIYGRAQQAKLVGVDNILRGYKPAFSLASITEGSKTLTVSGLISLYQILSPGDEIILFNGTEELKFGIESIDSTTTATMNKEAEGSISNLEYIITPKVPLRFLNRLWQVSGHKLSQAQYTITAVIAANRFVLNSTEDLLPGDRVIIQGSVVPIRRISFNTIVTESVIAPPPGIGATVTRLPIQKVFFGSNELVYFRDWTFNNTTSKCEIRFSNLAEFNITEARSLTVPLSFSNGSRTLTTTQVVDLRTILKPRDWIKKDSLASEDVDFYEVLDVKEQQIILRVPFNGITAINHPALYKSVDYIDDDSIITCDCFGIEADGKWIKTGAQAVRHLLTNDAGYSNLDEESFVLATEDAPYTMSLILPSEIGGQSPKIRDVITNINESIFGSLYGNSSLDLVYSVLNSDKPGLDNIIQDDDILSFSSDTTNEIYNNVKIDYRPFVNILNGEASFKSVNYNSGFVDKYVGTQASIEKVIYLFDDDAAQTIAERMALFRSMANTKITLSGKMNFYLTNVNDKVFINLERLFSRFGGGDRRKISIVTGVKRSSYDVELVMSDLGNIFNRVGSIAPDAANDFLNASRDEKILYGYIVDDDTLTPDVDDDSTLGANIIG